MAGSALGDRRASSVMWLGNKAADAGQLGHDYARDCIVHILTGLL